jgi:hypothetical protein
MKTSPNWKIQDHSASTEVLLVCCLSPHKKPPPGVTERVAATGSGESIHEDRTTGKTGDTRGGLVSRLQTEGLPTNTVTKPSGLVHQLQADESRAVTRSATPDLSSNSYTLSVDAGEFGG